MRAEYVVRRRTSQAPSFTPFYHNVAILSVLATEGQKGDPLAMVLLDQRQRISAVLGPTNTGKTYLAIERMLGHRTGMRSMAR